MQKPKIVLLVSGKRKCGKDYICAKIQSILPEAICSTVRISGPLKRLYAQTHNLNFEELLSDGPYKEQYRLEMIKWSDEIRQSEPGTFCKAACSEVELKPVWLVSDVRRKTDITWFRDTYGDKIKTVLIKAELETRKNRGWVFTEGVDDVESECNLDDFRNWDLEISNDTDHELDKGINNILRLINTATLA